MAEDRQVYPDQMAEDLSSVSQGRWGEEDLAWAFLEKVQDGVWDPDRPACRTSPVWVAGLRNNILS